jgi:hypothetical protein
MEEDAATPPPTGAQTDAEAVRRLAAEPDGQYYARLYREYIAAKKALGEPTDHISETAFLSRIKAMEEDWTRKNGRPVRYQVNGRNNEVVLIAVPVG